jgi:hypothetical protein
MYLIGQSRRVCGWAQRGRKSRNTCRKHTQNDLRKSSGNECECQNHTETTVIPKWNAHRFFHTIFTWISHEFHCKFHTTVYTVHNSHRKTPFSHSIYDMPLATPKHALFFTRFSHVFLLHRTRERPGNHTPPHTSLPHSTSTPPPDRHTLSHPYPPHPTLLHPPHPHPHPTQPPLPTHPSPPPQPPFRKVCVRREQDSSEVGVGWGGVGWG